MATSMIRNEGGDAKQVIPPVGLRFLWSIGASLGVGALICLLGLLLTDPVAHEWAIGAYIGGLVFAAGAAILISQLAARRRRVGRPAGVESTI